MILNEFIKTYGLGCGNDLISIKGYCEEYVQDDVISADWYDKIKYKQIKRWQTIGGGMYPVEICIELDDKSHKRWDRIQRDNFINKLFEDLEIPLLRYPVYENYYKKKLKKQILEKIKK